jgi:farnesyl-diphosphate farnesyltransferase
MSDQESHHERELGGQLLASVSRSFYLTLKALPKELREPLSLAYLLARTADTIADTAAVSAEVRLHCLKHYHELIQQPDEQHQRMLSQVIASDFVKNQADEAERRLMERFEDGLAWLRTMQGSSLIAIQQVLERIIHGQTLDIQRFPCDGVLRCLQSTEELDEYTWLVAGCVGEFWTMMCALEKPDSLDTSVSTEQMKFWGTRLGKGLQLINILRDVGEDLRDGRCYLPGHSPADLEANPHILQNSWKQWLVTCREHLECGLHYVQHVADGKLRYATSLPLLLGAKTLTRMQSASWEELQKGIKISRLDVAMILAEAVIACRSPDGISKLFRRLNQ